MKLRSILLLTPAVLVLMTAVASAQQPSSDATLNASQIEKMMDSSIKNLTSYGYEENLGFSMAASNGTAKSSYQEEITSEEQVDLVNKSTKFSDSYIMRINGREPVAHDTSGYLINGTEYMLSNNTWSKYTSSDPSLAWEWYNEAGDQRNLVDYSKMALVGSEEAEGLDCYKLSAVKDYRVSLSFLGPSVSRLPYVPGFDSYGLNVSDVNLTKLVNSSDISFTAWIAKDTGFLKRTDITMNYTLTPDLFDLPQDKAGDFKVQINTTDVTDFYDFNDPIEIILPEEAKDAIPLVADNSTDSSTGSGCSECNKKA